VNLQDFYFTGDDYRYRFDVEAKGRFVKFLREQFNSGVSYKGRVLKWDTIIEQKATELGRVLVNKSLAVDFAEPLPRFVGDEDRELRGRILTLSQSEARRRGIGKSTLHYLRKNAASGHFLRIYKPVREKLENSLQLAERSNVQ
jgi:hypothetical protein